MKRTRDDAIATLVRWREFEEACVSAEYRTCYAQAQRDADGVATAQLALLGIRKRQVQLQATANLDLERIRLVGRIEEAAWENLQQAERTSVSSEARRLEALEHHALARANTRVGRSRLQSALAATTDSEEKRSFDRIADLYRAGRAPHD